MPLRLDGGATAWCAQWDEPDEAVARLVTLWAAWEATNLEGGSAPSVWWVHHLDPQWAVLTATNGPLAACNANRHQPDPPPLPPQPETHRGDPLQPPASDDGAMSAIARVLGQPDPTGTPLPSPPTPDGGDLAEVGS